MISLEADTHTQEDSCSSSQDPSLSDLTEAAVNVTPQDSVTANATASKGQVLAGGQRKIYSRLQLLYLSKSPLVQPPDSMPAFKDWFGDWNEQQNVPKKESDTSSIAGTTRERRFRRDPEDGDAPRPSFRSTLSQPSQMGNFRHQSLRTTERDKDRDSERERERDLRDKEGQERLRNLSDKYDRDRLALSSSSSSLRNKERDSAPHLATTTSSRLGQVQNNATASRRGEGRETSKRKVGESSEDWRRAPDSQRLPRDDKSDNSRRERDRPRSRVRDTSRSRRDLSSSRRDREERDRPRDRRGDADRDKEDYPRRERDDNHRREREDPYTRNDRDRDDHDQRDRYRSRHAERDLDDDSRHWRDDGKRDERVVTRRERERPWERIEERDRERPNASDDRDVRSRRGVGRDRRLGGAEDGKDREDRRERDREREAEPAWMETYIPSTPGGGILGGRSGDGEIDGIQAWKRGMKEKERQEKENVPAPESSIKSHTDEIPARSTSDQEGQLDEIQLFKIMMKREAEKKGEESPTTQQETRIAVQYVASGATTPLLSTERKNSPALDNKAESQPASTARHSRIEVGGSLDSVNPVQQAGNHLQVDVYARSQSTTSSLDGAQSVPASAVSTGQLSADTGKVFTMAPSQSIAGSRSLASPGASGIPTGISLSAAESPPEGATTPSTFHPPQGSRLLAFGSRITPGSAAVPDVVSSRGHGAPESTLDHFPPPGIPDLPTSQASVIPQSAAMQYASPSDALFNMGFENIPAAGLRHAPTESSRVLRHFAPQIPSQSANLLDEFHDGTSYGQLNDLRRSSAVERAAFGLPSENIGTPGELGNMHGITNSVSPSSSLELPGMNIPGGANYATGKGSRLAKFLDSKTRDTQSMGSRKASAVPGFSSPSPHPDHRQPGVGHNGMGGAAADTRTMEDIFAMLQNSAQNHRVSPQIPPNGRILPGGGPFSQNNADMHHLSQQIHPRQQFAQSSQLDALYDSRLDDRNFVPDGMVPGLRPAPPRARSREPSGVLFNEQLDDPLHFNVRLQQQRNLEQLYSGPTSSMYPQQPASMLRAGGIPMQQQQFRGGPSPIANQSSYGGPPQRLPPGLANLGGRPPHDPSQYLGGPMGGLNGGLQSGLHGSSPAQQAYNNFGVGNGVGFGATPQARGPPGPQNPLLMNGVPGVGLQNSLDLRAANQGPLLGMNGVGGGGLRGQAPGFAVPHGLSGQPSASHLGMRQQQQQQQLPPHLMPHMMPPHLQPQQNLSGGNAQGAQDLMALLMGGHRD